MPGKSPLSVPHEHSSSSTILPSFAGSIPTVTTSLTSAQSQFRSLFWYEEFGRKEMVIAAVCGAATLACVCCGTFGARQRRLFGRKRGLGGREGEQDEVVGGSGGDSSSARASMSSGASVSVFTSHPSAITRLTLSRPVLSRSWP